MYGKFPQRRTRRLRNLPWARELMKETSLSVQDLVYPLFVTPGKQVRRQVSSMPGVFNFSPDLLVQELEPVADLGIKALLLFGIPEQKDEHAHGAYHSEGVVQAAIQVIKQSKLPLAVITDVCLCGYTSHGHCGIVRNGQLDNDATLELLARTALSHCVAGADMVAPSDMMDGRVGRIRQLLDQEGFQDVPIMSYAAKFASAFFGPFREAVHSAPQFGDRRSHQLDPANLREAELRVLLDLEEGADVVMVKPALAYLDVIRRVKEKFLLPVAAYSVSGEYAMVKAAAQRGWLEEEQTVLEIHLSIKRAGADIIISYYAPSVAQYLRQSSP